MNRHDTFLTIILLTTMLLTTCGTNELSPTPTAMTQASPTVDNNAITILALGDSLTAGFGVAPNDSYPAQLERKLRADGYNVTITNAGISGETSSAALSRAEWVMRANPQIVIIETGGNDGLRGIDLAITRENIDLLTEQFTANGTIVVVAGMQIISNLGEAYASEFASIYPDVADAHDAILIPFFLEGVAADPELNQADYIHPTAEGYRVIVEQIYPFVEMAIASAE
ncbi:MAG: arylesterase [Candidatus Promineifilaceae bacterium]